MKPPLTATQKLAALAADSTLPALLVLGILVPDDTWSTSFGVALLPVFACLLWRYGSGGRWAGLALLTPLVWIAWLGASGGWGSESAREEWEHHSLAALMTGIFFVSGVIWVRSVPPRWLAATAICLVIATTIALLTGVALHLSGGAFAVRRLSGLGLFGPQNLGSFIAAFIGLVALHVAVSTRSRAIRAAIMFYLGLAFLHIFLAGSRGGLVVLPVTLAAYLAYRDPGGARRPLLIGAAGVTASFAALLIFLPDLRQFLDAILTRGTHRVVIWQDTLHLSRERFLLGFGIGDDTEFSGRFSHPHNLHLSNLFYGGIPALILGLLTIAAGLVLAWRIPDRSQSALAVAAILLVVLSTLAHGSIPISKPDVVWYYFWAPLALAWGLALRNG